MVVGQGIARQTPRVSALQFGLDDPRVHRSFGGIYEAFFDALRRQGVDVRLDMSVREALLRRPDVFIAPVGEGQELRVSIAMSRSPAPAVLYVPPAVVWFREGFLRRWRGRLLFAYGTDESEHTASAYAAVGVRYHTLPFASDPRVMRQRTADKRFDVVFAGSPSAGQGRERYIEPLSAALGADRILLVGGGWEGLGQQHPAVPWGDPLAELYASARVGVNIHTDEQRGDPSLRCDANNRLFDLAMAGIPQVDNAPAVAGVYFAADELMSVSDPREWVRSVQALLADPGGAAQMAARARDRALAEHTWDARARDFRSWLEEGLSGWEGDRASPLVRAARARDWLLPVRARDARRALSRCVARRSSRGETGAS